MADLKKVNVGDALSIPAPDWNAMVDAAKAHRDSLINTDATAGEFQNRSTIFPIRNTTGSDLGRFAVLGIDQPIFDPAVHLLSFKNSIAFDGVIPDSDSHKGKFAILLEPAKDGKIANACFVGVCVAQIDMLDENHKFAEIKDASTDELESGDTGTAQILWVEPGIGVKLAYVRVGVAGAQSNSFWGGITKVKKVSGKYIWRYTFVEVAWNFSTSKFEAIPSGRTGIALNGSEFGNTEDGEMANGVDIGSIEGTVVVWPVAIVNRTVIRIWESTSDLGETKYIMSQTNAVTVETDPPSDTPGGPPGGPPGGTGIPGPIPFSCRDLEQCSCQDLCTCDEIKCPLKCTGEQQCPPGQFCNSEGICEDQPPL